jgi:hypothetical protein
MINSLSQSAGVPMTHSVLGFFVCASAPNFPWSGTPPYSTAMYHTIAASIHIAPYKVMLDSGALSSTSLDCLLWCCAVFVALRAY